ncbi:MAG: hypothetical protein LBO77_00775 [Desulfovibrio sp.]|jgi:hypothetical protein|nr:hypothetical protein [Desulfovibrio sp.]
MKASLINGSPKKNNSASASIIKAIQIRMEHKADCTVCNAASQKQQEILESFDKCNALVFVFPLYVDSLPSHLLRLLDDIWNKIADYAPQARIYAVVNNGFYEGRQNAAALEVMRNFCACAGLQWGQGLGVGAGGMIFAAPVGHGPLKNLGRALDLLAENILEGKTGDDYLFEPNFPKFLYKTFAHLGWIWQARKNGLKIRQMWDKSKVKHR